MSETEVPNEQRNAPPRGRVTTTGIAVTELTSGNSFCTHFPISESLRDNKVEVIYRPAECTFCLMSLPDFHGLASYPINRPTSLHPSCCRKPSLCHHPILVVFCLLQAPISQDCLVALGPFPVTLPYFDHLVFI